MARIELLIPFVLHWETGAPVLRMSPEGAFEWACLKGYSCVEGDRGGHTMCGVTLGTYREYRRKKGFRTTDVADLKCISYAEWLEIMKQTFWDRWNGDGIDSQRVANMLVDWMWHSGAGCIRRAQRVIGVVADGIVGPKTLAAINAADSNSLFQCLRQARLQYVEDIVSRRPDQKKFLTGWRRRILSL